LVFKDKGFLKNVYALTDNGGRELLIIQPEFKWKKLKYE